MNLKFVNTSYQNVHNILNSTIYIYERVFALRLLLKKIKLVQKISKIQLTQLILDYKNKWLMASRKI